MSALLLFLRSPLAKYLGLALAVMAVLGAFYAKGRGDGRRIEQAAQALRVEAARKAVAKVETRAVAITERVAVKAEARQIEIRTVTKEIVREVPRYITIQADAQCSVPIGFVRLHDAAAAGHLPGVSDAPGQSNDAPSGVALSSVASTVADNYGTCHAEIARFSALQEWVRSQADNRVP